MSTDCDKTRRVNLFLILSSGAVASGCRVSPHWDEHSCQETKRIEWLMAWIWEFLTLCMKIQYPSLEAFGSTFTGPGWMEESRSRAQIWSGKTHKSLPVNGHILLYQKKKQQHDFYLTVLSPGFISSLPGSPSRRYTLNLRPINRVRDALLALLPS